MDVASKLIASTTITNAKTFPVSYKLKYNPSDIKPHNTYAVSVIINGPDGKLLFINDVQSRVELTGSASTTRNVAVIKSNKFYHSHNIITISLSFQLEEVLAILELIKKYVDQLNVQENQRNVHMVIKNKMVVKFVNVMIHAIHLEKYFVLFKNTSFLNI